MTESGAAHDDCTQTEHPTNCRCSDGTYCTTDVQRRTEEGSTANCTHQIRFYDARGCPGRKRIRKFRRRLASDARMVRRTHTRDRMPQHGRITAHWKSGQQAAGRPGSARFATEGCTCSAKTRGKAGQKRGLALGHITTEQPATDPADSPVCIGLRTFGFVFSPKENQGKKTLSTKYCGESVFHFSPFLALGPRDIDVLR